ncbi:hypothetical protein [Arundinibacter roseus]|uniref:Uncharacterized protein n=1 Tax=Arundinibacter roseus TaxID=2070510 RepID=A0A4R4KGL8_9BACT|nr:hypothetical protein [Arundinibacter roseus]TDB66843.1 hypothetical protein EZE20_06875 [Arundinibacter roseus]
MKHESKTIGQSRTWAAALCGQLEDSSGLEASAALFVFWEWAVRESKNKSPWLVYLRWGCSRPKLIRKRDDAMKEYLEKLAK